MRNRPLAKALAVLALLPLAACLSVPASSVGKLSRLSPLEADPAALRFAVVTPQSIRVRTGDIRLAIRFDGPDAARSLIEESAPVIIEEPPATPGIRRGPDGARIQVAYLAPEDAARFATIQRRIKAWRADGVKGQGQLSLSATGCAAGPVGNGPLPVTTWIRTSPADDFFQLNRPVDMRTVLKAQGLEAGAIPACE